MRIALANIEIPKDPHDSVERVLVAIADAARAGARIVCFPEAYVPGYPWAAYKRSPLATASFLREAHASVARAAAAHQIGVVLGTERFVSDKPRLTALVVAPDGEVAGYQDKVQLDLPEDAVYEPGCERRLFEIDDLCFGIVICHEGFRYPEATRWAARRGAQLVFDPFYDEGEPGAFQPTEFADSRSSFHEKTFLCRAAENSCFFAAVNCASPGSATTSAVVRPDGSLLCYQPYGQPGLLVCDIDPAEATGLMAQRFRANSYA
ncbi:MAG TPA: carbon-nitrogen hydrolase family protein [Polyangiales bacterium]|jgi:predicted amidohydrolase|nr:carbon-nitrogen hydrolase family protein [Polyangiales bacterium]